MVDRGEAAFNQRTAMADMSSRRPRSIVPGLIRRDDGLGRVLLADAEGARQTLEFINRHQERNS